MIPIWELWPFTVYPWYGVCRRSLWSCPEKPWWKLSHTQAAFSLFCHLDPTSLFPGSSKNQPHWPLIHLFRFFSLLFNHLSPHLYLPSDSFSLQDGQSFSTSLPYVQFLSHLLNHFYYSLTVHSDNRVTRADGLVYEGRGSLSFIPLPSLSQPTLFVKPEGMQSPSLSDVPKSCVADSQPLLSVRSCHFFSTQDCGGLVPMCLVCHTLSSIDSVMEWPLQLCRGWEWGSCDRCSLDVCCWSCQLAVPEPWTRTTQLLRMTAEWPLDFSLRSTLPLMTRITEEIHTDRLMWNVSIYCQRVEYPAEWGAAWRPWLSAGSWKCSKYEAEHMKKDFPGLITLTLLWLEEKTELKWNHHRVYSHKKAPLSAFQPKFATGAI